MLLDGKPAVTLDALHSQISARNLPGELRDGAFRGASDIVGTDDGWLVGFNNGEFGGELDWFNPDGTAKYMVSHDQVVAFFTLHGEVHAIEDSLSDNFFGSVIRLGRTPVGAKWNATTVARFTSEPLAVSVQHDGTLLVALDNSLVSVNSEGRVRTLIADSPWSGLNLQSSVLTTDERSLYLGMRQFVAKVDLERRDLKLLIPSLAFLHQLSQSEIDTIRSTFSQRNGGSQKDLERAWSPNIEQACRETECRDELAINVRLSPQTYYKGTWSRSPYFYHGWGGIAMGEVLSFEAAADAEGHVILHRIPHQTDESINIKLWQPGETHSDLMSMVTIENKSKYHITYDAEVYYARDGAVHPMPTSVCALHPGLSTVEEWPYGVLFFAFGNLRSVSQREAENHGCR